MTNTTAKNPFEYRTTPKNHWELIWWVLIDKNKVEKHIESLKLNWWQERLLFLKIYFIYVVPLVCGLTFILWFVGISCIALTDLPIITPSEWWEEDVLTMWGKLPDVLSKLSCLFISKIRGLAFGLAFGLALGLVFGLVLELALGLVFGLTLSLIFGLSFGFLRHFFEGFFATFIFGLLIGGDDVLILFLSMIFVWGLCWGFACCTIFGFFKGFFLGFIFYLVAILGINLGVFLAFNSYIVWSYILEIGCVFVLGIILSITLGWIFCFLLSRFDAIDNNLYLRLGSIDASLFAEKRFIKQTQENPKLALQFVEFLLDYHKDKQFNLAALLNHTARATFWKEAALNLDEKELELNNFKVEGFIVPETWQPKLTAIKNNLIIAEQTTQISLKKELFLDFVKALAEFRIILLVPRQLTWRDKISMTRRIDWQYYYREAIEEWIRIAKQKLAEYEEIAQRTEPISRNFYLTGVALVPDRNEVIFMNRTDLHNELSLKIHTTSSLAVFSLQGQRRVGKTSLVKFLPKILGRRFQVVYLDLQGNITSVEDFLFKLRREFNTKFAITEKTEWLIPSTWAAALHELYAYIGEYAKEKDVKIILAIDEYEYLQQHLSKDLAQAQEFLGAFRHFSQHQDHISLMFVGLKFFSELQNPNWNEYFVNAISIRVDYLNQEESFKLIEVSKLDFEAGAKEKIFELTQGHPALIQKICYEIVNIANVKGSKHIAWADVEKALKIMIYVSVNGVTDIFWTQTCELPEDKEVVWAIIEKQEIPKTHRLRLRRLIEYGFILENEAENSYALRVPIFEQWVKKFS